jgi:hypothetical protein
MKGSMCSCSTRCSTNTHVSHFTVAQALDTAGTESGRSSVIHPHRARPAHAETDAPPAEVNLHTTDGVVSDNAG